MNYVFYDFETSGRSSSWDQIIEVGAVLVNDNFQVLADPLNIRCSLKPGLVPEPYALIVNKRPVIFFTGYFNYENKAAFGGIDLILMPPMMRIPFFNRIMGVYESQIESNMRKIESGDTKSQSQLKTDYETLNAILNNIPFKNSYRAWDLKKVRDVIEIPYTDWTRIVYLHTRSIEGTQIEEIYKKNLIP